MNYIVEHHDGFAITAITKLKHAALWKAATQLGGQSALARHLDMTPGLLGAWVNMKACPPEQPTWFWPEARLRDTEAKLLKLTGQAWDELWPQHLRDNLEFLNAPKRFEKTATIQAEAMEHYAIATTERLERQAISCNDTLDIGELRDAVTKTLRTLTYREREIIKLRYGLGDGEVYTTEEVAYIFKVTRERIHQIEVKAIRKLQQPGRSAMLAEFMPDVDSTPGSP